MSTTKKTTLKTACALALSGALALALAPAAFAAAPTPSVDSNGTAFVDNEQSTAVKVATDATQLSAEVPLNMKIVAKPAGGDLGTGQVPTTYAIKNTSTLDIYVTDVTAEAGTNWTYVDSNSDATLNSAPSGKTGVIHLGLTPASGTLLEVEKATSSTHPNWLISAATSKTLAVSGKTSPLSNQTGDDGELAATLHYTIAATQA